MEQTKNLCVQSALGTKDTENRQEINSAEASPAQHEEAGLFSEKGLMKTELEARDSIDNLPEFFTPGELSQVLPVSRATLYRMAEQKRIPSFRVGRRVIIHRETFKKWFKQECAIRTSAISCT